MKVNGMTALLRFSKQLASVPAELRRTEELIMKDWLAKAQRGFVSQSDPYGNRWARRKINTGRPILTGKTRRLKSLKLVRVAGHRWKIDSAGKAYLPFHQKGTSRMVRRRIFPDDGRLPAAWRASALKIYRARMKALLSK